MYSISTKNYIVKILLNEKLQLVQHITYYLPCFSSTVLKLVVGATCNFCSICIEPCKILFSQKSLQYLLLNKIYFEFFF